MGMHVAVPFLYSALFVTCLLVAGIFVTCREYGICSNQTFREILMWGGGFILYAVFDYFIFMG